MTHFESLALRVGSLALQIVRLLHYSPAVVVIYCQAVRGRAGRIVSMDGDIKCFGLSRSDAQDSDHWRLRISGELNWLTPVYQESDC